MNAITRLICMAAFIAIACRPVANLWAAEEKKGPGGPRAMFRDLGVKDSYFNRLVDGRPLDADEQETVLRILFRLRVFPPVDLDRWALDIDKLDAKSRGEIVRLRGKVSEIEPIKPLQEAAQRYELARYYRCRVQLGEPSQNVDVYTENVPAAWQKGAKPDADAGALGVFLKNAGKSDGQSLLVFAAPRLAWYPDDLLGRLGMDYGLFDTVQDQKPITAQDREAFYQLLAAVGRAAPDQLLEQAEANLPKLPENMRWTDQENQEHYSVVPLFNDAAAQRGRLVELSGIARRVEEIFLDEVQDADIIARFGFNHYFQISLFTGDSDANPLTFCVRELPEGMPFGNLPRYGEMVRIAGFFFKTWRYAVPKQADPASPSGDLKTAQLSPLLIGQSVTWRPVLKPTQSSTSSTVVIGVLFVAVMVIVWIVAWRNRLREKRWEEKLSASEKLDENIDFSHVGQHIESADPDFGRIAEMDHGEELPESVVQIQEPEKQPPSEIIQLTDLQSSENDEYHHQRAEWVFDEAMGLGILSILASLWAIGMAVSKNPPSLGTPSLLALILFIAAIFDVRRALRKLSTVVAFNEKEKSSWRKRLWGVGIVAVLAILPTLITFFYIVVSLLVCVFKGS